MKHSTNYIRFHSARRPQFQIVTEMIKDQGQDYFIKRALTPNAQNFIEQMPTNCAAIRSAFSHCNVLEAQMQSDGSVRFEALAVATLADHLLEALNNSDRARFIERLQYFAAILRQAKLGHQRSQSECEFSHFIQSNIKLGEDCIAVGALDFGLDNILTTAYTPTIIDYEWTFDFSIPRSYIAFRSICGFYGRVGTRKFQKICSLSEALQIVGVDPQDHLRFIQFEEAFERHTSEQPPSFGSGYTFLINPEAQNPFSSRETVFDKVAELERECNAKQEWILKLSRDIVELNAAIDQFKQHLSQKADSEG